VGAGTGSRAGAGPPKQYRMLLGRPVLRWSVDAFRQAGVERIVAAIGAGQAALAREAAGADVAVVEGGASRTASVRAGLAALGEPEIILIHDAARPGLFPSMIHALAETIGQGFAGAAPALPLSDALRRVDAEQRMIGEVERDGLM